MNFLEHGKASMLTDRGAPLLRTYAQKKAYCTASAQVTFKLNAQTRARVLPEVGGLHFR